MSDSDRRVGARAEGPEPDPSRRQAFDEVPGEEQADAVRDAFLSGAGDRVAPPGSRGREQALLRLQASHGNAYVQRVVADLTGDARVPGRLAGAPQSEMVAEVACRKGSGTSLPDGARDNLQSFFGTDLAGITVHTDADAAALTRDLDATAFTVGDDVFIAPDAYDPHSTAGQALLAHEIAHSGQQGAVDTGDSTPASAGAHVQRTPAPHEPGQDGETGSAERAAASQASADRLMSSELSAAGSDSGVTVRRGEGEPSVLDAHQQPPAPADQAQSIGVPPPSSAQSAAGDVAQAGAQAGAGIQSQAQAANTDVGAAVQAARAQVAGLGTGAPATPSISTAPPVSGSGSADLATVPDLQQQIPQRELGNEELAALVQAGRSPEEDRLAVQQQLSQLRQAVDAELAAVAAEAEQQKTQLAAQAEAHAADIQSTAEAQIGELQQELASASAGLVAQADQRKAALQASLEGQIAQVRASVDARKQALDAQLTDRQTAFDAFILEQAALPSAAADREAARAASELDSAAAQAVAVGQRTAAEYPGDDDSKPKQREAATDLANQSAEDIRAKKSDIADDLRSRAAGVAERYPDYGVHIRQQIDEVRQGSLPSADSMAATTVDELGAAAESTSQAIDGRLQMDLQALESAGAQMAAELRAGAAQAVGQVRHVASDAAQQIDQGAAQLTTHLQQTVATVEGRLADEPEPYLPGATELIQTTQAGITTSSSEGRGQLGELSSAAESGMVDLVAQSSAAGTQLLASATDQAQQITTAADTAAQQSVQAFSDGAQTRLDDLSGRLDELAAAALGPVDEAIGAARSEMRAIGDRFRAEIGPATDQSIAEAKKPLTDPLPDRTGEAARHAGESWFSGLLRAVGQIVVGLLIVVALALIVAAVAGFFGVLLTAWTAIMIAGAILLLVGLAFALVHRFTQPQLSGAPWYKKVGLALIDTIGATGIIEGCITGKDIVTGERLSDGERTYQGVTGVFTAVMLVFGARSAFRGPPGGTYTSPTSLSGWAGAWGAIKDVGGDLVGAGGKLVDWVRDRLAGRTQAPPDPQPNQTPVAPADAGRETPYRPGLYQNIDPNVTKVASLEFTDLEVAKVVENGVTLLRGRTSVTATDPATGEVKSGYMIRSLDPTTGEFRMEEAFLDQLPKDARMVPTDPPMLTDKGGTPLEAYMTMRLMKLLQQAAGDPAIFSGARVVRMTHIENVMTILDLAEGKPVRNTPSVNYANNSIVQSGGRIGSAEIQMGTEGKMVKARSLSELVRDDQPNMTQERLDALLNARRIDPETEVPFDFDIVLNVEGAGVQSPAGQGAAPVPVVPAGQLDGGDQNP